MIRKEDVEKIKQQVSEMEKERRKLDEVIPQERSYADIANEAGRISSVKLRETGVVDLMEAIRDEGILKLRDKPSRMVKSVNSLFGERLELIKLDFEPAVIWVKCDGTVTMQFDGNRLVGAEMEGGSLIVWGEERMVVGKDLSLVDAVGRAILNPRVVEDRDY